MSGLARAAAVAFALFVVFNANLRGIGSRDTRVVEHLAFSLAAYGRADLDAFAELHETGLAKGWLVRSGGHVRSTYPVVPAVLAAPAYAAAIAIGVLPAQDPPLARLEAIGKLSASAMTAAACGVLFLILRRRWLDRLAAAIAIAAGLTTPLWSSASQALWSHGPAALLLAIGIFAATADDARATSVARTAARSRWHLVFAGLAFMLAGSCRPLLAFFLAGHLFATWRVRGASGLLAFTIGVIVAAVPLGAYNIAAFGHIAGGAAVVESGAVHRATHDVSSAWSGNPGAGLAGILFSPSRGVLIFMPVVLVALAGARDILQRRTMEVWSLVVPAGLFVVGWSLYSVWWAGHSFGPRYAADLAIPLALVAAAAFGQMPRRRSSLRRAGLAAIVAWSLFVQSVGAFCYPGGDWNGTPADVDRAHARLWDWRDSQIPRTIRAGIYRPHFERF
ncbi:MAG TPA: hypothetical protein VFO19_02935 [Vicinamibacterales bacterium]|nr:hypothetical protein [Vicinamibacterales bacterium]